MKKWVYRHIPSQRIAHIWHQDDAPTVEYLYAFHSVEEASDWELFEAPLEFEEEKGVKGQLRSIKYPTVMDFADAYYWQMRGDPSKMDLYLAKVDNVKKNIPIVPPNVDLASEKKKLKDQNDQEMNIYLDKHYSAPTRDFFTIRMFEAAIGGLTNRLAYITSILTWVGTLTGYNLTKNAEIDACADLMELGAITWDYEQFTATDPLASVGVLESILD